MTKKHLKIFLLLFYVSSSFSSFFFNFIRSPNEKVVLVIIQNANSIPQFGQSFSSSSITDSSGKVLSKSVYTDSTGRKIIDGAPQLEVDLLPPFLPNQIPGLALPVSPPFNKPVVAAPSTDVQPPLLPTDAQRVPAPVRVVTTPTTTTARPTVRSTTTARAFVPQKFAPAVSNFVQQSSSGTYKSNGDDGAYRVKNGQDGSYRFKGLDDGSYKVKGDDGKYRNYGNDGTYRPTGNLGTYVHNNAGRYVHDDRVKKI